MAWPYRIVVLGIIPFLFLPSMARSDKEIPFTESVVIFNTVCAKCHEAECSGRMSFDDALESSRNHIIRHYGEAADRQWLQEELFTILNYMKVKCAYYPMQTVLPYRRVWSGAVLKKMATLLERNYFIPLGPFAAGKYRIDLKMEKDTKVTVHLVSEGFEMAVEDCFLSTGLEIKIPVSIADPGNYYFRLYPQEPVQITRLEIIAVEERGLPE